jgi:hypothetical protein
VDIDICKKLWICECSGRCGLWGDDLP